MHSLSRLNEHWEGNHVNYSIKAIATIWNSIDYNKILWINMLSLYLIL